MKTLCGEKEIVVMKTKSILQTQYCSTTTDKTWQHHYRLYMAAPLQTLYGSTITDSIWQHHYRLWQYHYRLYMAAPLQTQYGCTLTDSVKQHYKYYKLNIRHHFRLDNAARDSIMQHVTH